MKAAVIANGTVTNVIEVANEQAASEFNAVLCSGEVARGWTYSGGVFTDPTPAPTLVELKEQKLSDLAKTRWQQETGGITVGGAQIATDRESQALINGAYALASLNTETADFTIDFKGSDGWVSLTAAQMIATSVAVGQHVQACFKRERALSALIEAATDAAGLEAIDLETGWP